MVIAMHVGICCH